MQQQQLGKLLQAFFFLKKQAKKETEMPARKTMQTKTNRIPVQPFLSRKSVGKSVLNGKSVFNGKSVLNGKSIANTKKKRRAPNTVMFREMKQLQKSTEPMTKKGPAGRYLRTEVHETQGLGSDPMRLSADMIPLFQEAIEKMTQAMVADAVQLLIHAGRRTLLPKDLKLAQYLRNESD